MVWWVLQKLTAVNDHRIQHVFSQVCTQKNEARIQTDTYTPLFLTAPFTVRRWKQLKCPSTVNGEKNVFYPYNGLLISHKKE